MIEFGTVDTLLDAERMSGLGFGIRYRERPDGQYSVYCTDWTIVTDMITVPVRRFCKFLKKITELS